MDTTPTRETTVDLERAVAITRSTQMKVARVWAGMVGLIAATALLTIWGGSTAIVVLAAVSVLLLFMSFGDEPGAR